MRHKKSLFQPSLLPYLLIGPQVVITLLFFILPAASAVRASFFHGDAFGLYSKFVWLQNFREVLTDSHYLKALSATAIFSSAVAFLALASALLLAVLTERVIRGKMVYKTLLIWPYAVAPAIAGILWRFLFNPAIGVVAYVLDKMGYHWDYNLNSHQAMFLVVIAAAWQQFSYNFIFFVAGLQAIPNSLLQAAAIDGAGPFRRFWTIVFPLLSPITFFLLIMNLIYAFFDTFGIIQVITNGGPAEATNILVFKIFNDGFVGLDVGGSSTQSVILMVVVIALTIIQFRYIERKVHY